jgi:hypothetical protein
MYQQRSNAADVVTSNGLLSHKHAQCMHAHAKELCEAIVLSTAPNGRLDMLKTGKNQRKSFMRAGMLGIK